MKYLPTLLVTFCLTSGTTVAQSFKTDVAPLIESSCIQCHDADTETGLTIGALGHDLSDAETFRKWERVFDRVHDGEMPPESEARPDPMQLKVALASLKKDLRTASLARQQRVGRVPARRLTKLEFGYTLRDLLLIESDMTSSIPDEVESGSFDTVGSTQRISAVHMESYLKAADEALKLAINLGENPYRVRVMNDYSHLDQWHEKPLNMGGNVTRKLKYGKGIALFRDVDYLMQFRFGVTTPGTHRLSAKVAAYQSKEPVTLKLIVKDPTGGARLVKAVDLEPGTPETIVVDAFLKPGDSPYLTFDMGGVEPFTAITAAGGSKNYKGRGLAIMSQKVEGPLFDSWPPPSTRQLLDGLELANSEGSDKGPFEVKASKNQLEHVTEIVRHFAPRAFRRQVAEGEIQSFVDLAKPALEADRDFIDVLRIPLRSMLSSPQFLLFGGEAGELDDHALANRLSYFLWKSMPDEQLFALVKEGKLSDSKVLARQVDRMLGDEKSNRFVRDFLGQWLRLYKVNATTPDEGLYPEYDELLAGAIPKEPELFFTELINENLSLTNLIDSDFTFVNRRLATLYGIPDVKGQQFRKVELPKDSPRGGVLTQAAILKTTANGTVTSPVLRGNFVLTNFLGTPPPPPPPLEASIEPDTRGKTTIREILAAHREIETCNTCHREIDPPGFAMESFNPIGGFRTHYRASGGELKFGDFNVPAPFKKGPPVDASGVTADGKEFSGINEFKQHLLNEKEQVAKHFISQLVVNSTGGEIQFADREEIEAILKRTRKDDFPVRDIIHEVVQSKLFRNK
ncbi:MAG: hypothetical protein CMJ64_02490 [Planctomycetaceae bacterium]|nr:hypothetical protein [Planctomycetaceae bacterium]